MVDQLIWFGKHVFHRLEIIGEAVAEYIGLNDSRFQHIIDGMSEEEWQQALEVNRQREEENRIYELSKSAGTLECGSKPDKASNDADAEGNTEEHLRLDSISLDTSNADSLHISYLGNDIYCHTYVVK